MARSAGQALLDEVIARGLAPSLREDGYQAFGHTFRREAGRCIQVVNVQTDRWSTHEALRFTLNLGLFYPEVHQVKAFLRWQVGRGGPTESECQLRARIGALMPRREDLWWALEPTSDAAALSEALVSAYRDQARPWLAALADFDAARAAAEQYGAPVDPAAFSLVAGDREEARALLAALHARQPGMTDVWAWAREAGLL